MDRGLNWERLDEIRQKWPGKLLLKGVLHPEDASLAVKAGSTASWSPTMEDANWTAQVHHLTLCQRSIRPSQGMSPFC
jgi:hypothetical protein